MDAEEYLGSAYTKQYRVSVLCEEETLSASMDDRELSIPNGRARRGYTQFHCLTDVEVAISSVVIEGTLDARARAELGARFADSKLLELGLGPQ